MAEICNSAVPDKPDSYWHVNQGQADDIQISHVFAFGEPQRNVVAADSKDTVTLMDKDWQLVDANGNVQKQDQNATRVLDDLTATSGFLFRDSRGDQVLVGGIDDVTKIKTGTWTPPRTHRDDVQGGLTDIENDPKNASGAKDGFVTADEIQIALDNNTIKGDGRTYWQGVVNSLKNDAASGKNDTHSSTRKGGQGQNFTGVTTDNLMDAENAGVDFGKVKLEKDDTITVDGVKGVKIKTTGMSDDEINNVKDYVTFLSKDKDGSKLLQAASKDKDWIVDYDSSMSGGLKGHTDFQTHHISLSKSVIDDKEKDSSTSARSDEGMTTFAHEFVHASTNEDDSRQEEALAEAVGSNISSRYYKFTPEQQNIAAQARYTATLNNTAYKDLSADNGIVDTLKNMGIDLSNINIQIPS